MYATFFIFRLILHVKLTFWINAVNGPRRMRNVKLIWR